MTGAMRSDSPRESLSPTRRLLLALGLLLPVLAVFRSVLGGEFVYDDLLVIQQNPLLRDLANLPQVLGSSYWDFLDAEGASHVGYYRPLTMALLTVAQVLGDGAPAAFHALSLLAYAACCLAAWRFAVRLLRSELAGFWAGLLFGLHPLHVESVAWISDLHDPLFGLFGFLSLGAFLRWRDGGSAGRPWAAGGWMLLALLSKDAAVALLPLALAVDLGRRRESDGTGPLGLEVPVRAYAPLVAAFGLYYLARVAVFGDALAGFDRQTTDFGVGAGRLLLLRVELLGGAAALVAWPSELNLFRPFQPRIEDLTPLLTGILGTLALLGATGVAWRRRWRPALALLLMLPAGLAPVLLRVESLGTFPLSDRFLFLPVMAGTGLVALGLVRLLPARSASVILAILAGVLAARSAQRIPDWQDEEALFRVAVTQNPRNPNAHWGLGRVLLARYRETGLSDHLIGARDSFERSMELLAEARTDEGQDIFATRDDHLQTNLGLGWSLLLEAQVDPFHDYATARKVFERVTAAWPDSERGWVGVGVAWMAEGDPNQAGTALRRAIQLNPASPEAHFNMGELLMRTGDWTGAVREFERCVELRSGGARDRVYLARALMEAGEDERAREEARRAHELAPDDPAPLVLLGTLLARGGAYEEAIPWFDRAIEREPRLGEAHLQRGNALAALERRSEAVAALEEACRLLPERFQPHYNLAALLGASNQPEASVPYFLVAYRLRRPDMDRRMKEAAEALHGGDVRLLGALATIDADRGDLPAARAWIEAAHEKAPDDPAVNFTLGVVLVRQEEVEAAAEPLRIAAEALPGQYEPQMEYAGALLQLDRPLESEPYLARALVLLEDQEMEPGLKDATRRTIQSTLAEIAKLRSGVGEDGR
jgi:tetratricopeptide (TPR) repeat protein